MADAQEVWKTFDFQPCLCPTVFLGADDKVPSAKVHRHRARWQPGQIPALQGQLHFFDGLTHCR